MDRRLSAEERALWRKVIASVRPLGRAPAAPAALDGEAQAKPAAAPIARPAPIVRANTRNARPGTTLDASWDRRLARGGVAPDSIVDLHGHNLAAAHAQLDRRLEQAIAAGDRLLLLRSEERRVGKGCVSLGSATRA